MAQIARIKLETNSNDTESKQRFSSHMFNQSYSRFFIDRSKSLVRNLKFFKNISYSNSHEVIKLLPAS